MKGRRILLSVAAMVALMVSPAQAEDFWSSFRKGVDAAKKDFEGFTGAIKGGIEGIREGKKEVEGIAEETERLREEFTGPRENEPRYDADWVAELQQRLTAEGFDPGPIDGAFGNRTSQAISAFQRQTGISPDGLPRPTVMRALRARTQGVQTAQPSPSTQRGAPLSHGPATEMETAQGPSFQAAPTAEPAYPDFVRLALRADPAAYAAQRETAGIAYRLAIMDEAACRQLSQRLAEMTGDAFLARDLALESADLLDEALAALDAAPQALEVVLSDRVHVQTYDFAAGGYPLPGAALIRGGKRSLTDRTSAPPCDAGLPLHHALPKSAMTISRVGLGTLSVELEGAPGASILPMAEGEARAFEARNARRLIDLVGHVRLEPPEAAFGPLRGRVLALEARDPSTGETLYRFPVVPEVAEAADPRAPGYVPTYEDFVYLALMSDLEAYLADAESTGFALIAGTADEGDCRDLYDVVRSGGNEFALRDLRAAAGARLRQIASTLDARPRRFEISVEAPYRLETYDFHREGFPFSGYQKAKQQQPILTPGVIRLPGGERPSACSLLAMQDAALFGPFVGLRAEHQGVPRVDLVPMPPEQARTFRAAGKNTVVLRAALVVEPRAQGRGPLAGRIINLSAHDPESGDLLHRYDLKPPTPVADVEDGRVRWTVDLVATLLAPVVEPALSDAALDNAAIGYFRRHKVGIDRGNPPPGSPLPMEAMRGQAPELIVAMNRDRLRAALREDTIETPIAIVLEEELPAEFRDGRGLVLPSFDGHQWLISAAPDAADPWSSAELSSRGLPLYPKTLRLRSDNGEPTFRTAMLSNLRPSLELDRIVHLEPIAASTGVAAARGFKHGYGPHVEPVIVRWELDVLGARMDGQTPVISARLTDLSFRWSSDDAPLAAVQVAALPSPSGAVSSAYEAGPPKSSTSATAMGDIVVGDVAFRTWPAGAAFGIVHAGSSEEPGQLVFVERWLDREMAQAVGLERGSRVGPLPDEEAVLAMTRGFDLLVSAKQFEMLGLSARDDLQIFPVGSNAEVAALAVVRPAPGHEPARASAMPDEPPSDPSATIDLAALAKLPAPEASADERGADAFKVLNVAVGMTEPEVLAAIADEFASDQISADPKSGTLRATRGACNDTDPADPAIASEAGAFCLELQLTDGAVSGVTLRQVVPGDVSERALAAFRERYGEPAFEDQSQLRPSVQRSVIGWGRALSSSPPDLTGIDADAPRTVLEGRVWHSHGVTVAVLRLDEGRAREGPDDVAVGQEIKF